MVNYAFSGNEICFNGRPRLLYVIFRLDVALRITLFNMGQHC